MGTVFKLPWAWLDAPLPTLRECGFKTVAMALRHDSIALDDPRLKAEPRLAVVMGTEGDGLPTEAIDDADYVVKGARCRLAQRGGSLSRGVLGIGETESPDFVKHTVWA